MAKADETKVVEIQIKTTGDADLKRLGKSLQQLQKDSKEIVRSNREMNASFASVGSTLKGTLGLLGAGFTLKGLISASEDMQQLNKNIKDVADSFIHATFEASGFAKTINDPTMWDTFKTEAVKAGKAIGVGLDYAWQALKFFSPALQAASMQMAALHEAAQKQSEQTRKTLSGLSQFYRDATRPLEGVTVTASVGAGAREDRAAAEQAAREVAAASKSAGDMMRSLQQSVAAQQELLDAATKSTAEYERMKDVQADAAELEKLRAQLVKAQVPDLEKQLQLAQDEIELRRQLADQTQMQLDMTEALAQLQADTYKALSDEIQKASDETQEAMKKANDFAAETEEAMNELGGSLSRTFSGLITGEIHNARDALRGLTQDMAQFFADLAAKAASQQLISGALSLFGIASAKGNAFDRGQIIPMARGGIVTQPTIFPMARGYGLMGEAGPEAVMPLRRGRDGKLGVSSSTPVVNIVNNLGVPATAQVTHRDDRMEIVLQAAHMGSQMAIAEVSRSVRSGYGATAQSMQGAYGLRRRL